MSDSDGDGANLILERIKQDVDHFSALLDLIPPTAYFSNEERNELWGNTSTADGENYRRWKSKTKLSSFTVSQLVQMRVNEETMDDIKNGKRKSIHKPAQIEEESNIATKHAGKKLCRTNKKNKMKAKEQEKREARLEELKARLQAKVEAMKARKNAGETVTAQERKRLRKEEKRVNAKLKGKQKNKTHKTEGANNNLADGLRSPPQNKILNSNGDPVKSKFDFSVISFGNDRARSSELSGRDYRRLLEKVERRKEKVEKLKEKDEEAGKKLEKKIQWQTVMSKAQGEKVKDDPKLLNKAAKRKDKIKERKKKKWGDRANTVKEAQNKRLDKREANIEKRKTDKKDKKRKKLIKKGRIIPGF